LDFLPIEPGKWIDRCMLSRTFLSEATAPFFRGLLSSTSLPISDCAIHNTQPTYRLGQSLRLKYTIFNSDAIISVYNQDDERPAGTRPTVADVADVRQLDLETQTVGFYSNWRSFFAKNYPKHCLDLLQSIPPSYFSKYRLQRSGHIQS
jgi:hypothetical protein